MGLNVHYTLSCDHCAHRVGVRLESFHETLDDAVAAANLDGGAVEPRSLFRPSFNLDRVQLSDAVDKARTAVANGAIERNHVLIIDWHGAVYTV